MFYELSVNNMFVVWTSLKPLINMRKVDLCNNKFFSLLLFTENSICFVLPSMARCLHITVVFFWVSWSRVTPPLSERYWEACTHAGPFYYFYFMYTGTSTTSPHPHMKTLQSPPSPPGPTPSGTYMAWKVKLFYFLCITQEDSVVSIE
jgi:hypothetical protein